MTSVAYYITGHGYGHAVRSLAVIRSLKETCPELAFHIRTPAPGWLFIELLFPISCSDRPIDLGIVQNNCLDMDIGATLRACESLQQRMPEAIDQEPSFIEETRAHVIVGDVPPLCFEIAVRAGLPSVAVTNFPWNWISRCYLEAYFSFLPLYRANVRSLSQDLALSRPPVRGRPRLLPDIAPYLDLLMRKEPNWREVPLSGAEVAASKVLELLG